MQMNKKWLLGGLGVVVLAGAGVAVWTGALPMPGAMAKSQSQAEAANKKGGDKKDGDKKPDVPLEFAPREVVQPALARLPGSVEFSGPLVAPQTAVVRAKRRGHAAGAGGGRRQPRAGRPGAGPHRTGRAFQPHGRTHAGIDSARATLVQAERTHSSNERLAAQQFISPIALEQLPRRVDTARANVSAAQAAPTPRASGCATARCWRPSPASWPSAMCCRARSSARTAGADHRRPGRLELAGSVGTHEVARLRPAWPCRCRWRVWTAGGRAHRAHRAGGRAGHALDRRDHRAAQPEGNAACRPVRAGPATLADDTDR
jgi:membrane fusion protein (multidrug efflux system)